MSVCVEHIKSVCCVCVVCVQVDNGTGSGKGTDGVETSKDSASQVCVMWCSVCVDCI
jgi:hypothetical protein